MKKLILAILCFLSGCVSHIDLHSKEEPNLRILNLGTHENPPMLPLYSRHWTHGTAVAIKGIGTVTANHVLYPEGKGELIMPNGAHVSVKKEDGADDILLLNKDGPMPLPPGPCPHIGDPVILFGAVEPYRTTGRILAVGVKLGPYGTGMRIEANINPGFSGGAVVDNRGRIVGIINGGGYDFHEGFAHDLSIFGLDGCN